MDSLDRKMEILSVQDSIPSHSSSLSEDEVRDEVVATSLASDAVTVLVTTKVADLGPDLLEMIFAKLPLRDCVRLHFGLSKKWRPLMSSKVFEGEPFFLRGTRSGDDPESNPPVAMVYAFSMQRWVQLVLPPSVQHLKPVSASSGLVLFSGIPSEGMIPLCRQWWPLVVVNPITRENRSLLLMVEPLPEMEEGYPDCYCQVHMGLKVNADSKTYKVVVVHWKANRHVVQVFDSGSNQWSTVAVPLDLVSYANSSNEIVFCRTYERGTKLHTSVFDVTELHSSVFDIRQGNLVDCHPATLLKTEMAANTNLPLPERTAWGHPTVGESCLYILSYNSVLPSAFAQILKRERSSQTWQLVAELSLDVARYILDPGAAMFIDRGLLSIHECGKHLLIASERHFSWCGIGCGMLYDLDKQRWNGPAVVNSQSAREYKYEGLFFQPQLNGPPC